MRPGGASGAAFRAELATTPDIPSQRVAASALEPGALAELAASIRAGDLTPEAAVQAIIDRALAGPAIAGLAPAARERLANALREQLTDDPALSALVADLGKAR